MTRARTLSKIGSDPAIFPGNVNITGVATATTFSGAVTGNVTGNASGSSGSCTGNAAGLTGTPNITVGAINASGISTVGVLTAYSAISADAGIDFSGAQTNATGMTSETLDSYEEGTWTVTLQDTAGNAISNSGETGHYTKIGNLVYCIFGIQVSDTTGAGNNLEIHGLPFACESVTEGGGEPSFGGLTFANNLVSTDLGGGVILRVNNGSSYIECKYTPGGAQTTIGGSAWNTSNISSSTYMTGSFQYRT